MGGRSIYQQLLPRKQFYIYIFPLFLYFIYGLLHDFPGFSLQSSEAPEADLDAGQTTGEPDTGGEREACCQGPDDGGVEGVARPQGVHHAPCEGHVTAAV